MGSSETGVADYSVGSIVWVRRRNGSWWPGKILGTDELSTSLLTSPRSGTPVKLLGREDASVDWYNLEKSKRVKAFRCGEFDESIERAEASQGIPPKKREKYARREDAILHALELERQLLVKKYGKVSYAPNDMKKKSLVVVTSSDPMVNRGADQIDSRSHQVSDKLDPKVQEKKVENHQYGEKVKEGNQRTGDDDNNGVLPRMRGLRDFGLRGAPPMRKLSPPLVSDTSQKPVTVISGHTLPNEALPADNKVDLCTENLSDKRKRVQEGLADDSLLRRHDKRRPLVQVLQNSAKLLIPDIGIDDGTVSIPVSVEEPAGVSSHAKRSEYAYMTTDSENHLTNESTHPSQMETSVSKFEDNSFHYSAARCEEQTSGSTEDTETDSSETDSLESDSDDEMTALSDGSIVLQPKYPISEEQEEDESMSSDNLDNSEFADYTYHPSRNDPVSTSMGVSRWQLKGKRKSRNLLKPSFDRIDSEVSGGYVHGKKSNWCSNGKADLIENNSGTPMARYGSAGQRASTYNAADWEGSSWTDRSSIRRYLEDSLEYIDPVIVGQHHTGGRIMLVDVELKVQANNYKRDVPMISLMSKLNGHAIVGHPIQIEALENGSSENLIASDQYYSGTMDSPTTLPSVWRTARRTANVRRPHMSAVSNTENKKHHQFVDPESKIPFGIPDQANMTTRSHSLYSMDKKFSRNSPKKSSLAPNQKIRTLSSIASDQQHGSDQKGEGHNYQVDGVVKTQGKPAAVACIPVNLVFSRLHEELVGRHQQ